MSFLISSVDFSVGKGYLGLELEALVKLEIEPGGDITFSSFGVPKGGVNGDGVRGVP